jgi:hypothetical protein
MADIVPFKVFEIKAVLRLSGEEVLCLKEMRRKSKI